MNPVTSALMRLVLFIDVLVSVVEWARRAADIRERRVMVTRTKRNFFEANDNQFGYNTRQSATVRPMARSWSS